ncbi:MAG: Gfo/Idh/MocA family oxidoreductase [Victivallales bacterium]|nr:Gfo/Idh/MocA family oxidoreductase [Victivallales bacterium]
MQLGMIGLDTSHVSELSKVFNDPAHPFHIQDMPVVKAFPGGSKNTSFSYNRVEKYTAELVERGIEMVDSIRDLDGLDGYLLESVDGLQHFEQFEQLVAFGKPVFIDKPLACSYTAAKAIYELSKKTGVPFFTASSIRYSPGVSDLCPSGEKVCSAEAFGPMALLPDYRDYFWYGIHTADTIYSYLGQGCQTVEAISRSETELLIGAWKDGRTGLCIGNHPGAYLFGARVLTDKTQHVGTLSTMESYMKTLSRNMAEFFRTGVSPIAPEESVEVIAFLEAASRSRAQGGKPVSLAEL